MIDKILDIIKHNFTGIVILIVALMYFGGCGPNKGNGQLISSDTTRRTVQEQQPLVILPASTPTPINVSYPINLPPNYQAVIPDSTIQGLVAQVTQLNGKMTTLAIDYYTERSYNDSIQLKDTAGNRVGVVNLAQLVRENRIQSFKPSYQLSFPHTYTNVTNNYKADPKNQVYFGGGIQSSIQATGSPQVNLGVMFKNKKDLVFNTYGTYNPSSGEAGIGFSIYKKIKLGK